MTNWTFILTKHEQFPNPRYEVNQLTRLWEEGHEPEFPLADRDSPPGMGIEPGDWIHFVASEDRDRCLAKARAVKRPLRRREPRAEMAQLYGSSKNRWWVRVRRVSRIDEDLPLEGRIGRGGQAYVKKWTPVTSAR